MMKILLAGAKSSEKDIFNSISRQSGHTMYFADDKNSSINQLNLGNLDLVVIGSEIPITDGTAVIEVAKKNNGSHYIPVLAIVTVNLENQIQAYLDAGIDDFITGSLTELLLDTKLHNIEKMEYFSEQAKQEHSKLENYKQHLQSDLQIAKVIFSKILRDGNLDNPAIKYNLGTDFSYKGELLIAQKRPNNDLCIMLGDFPGHGLQASIGAIPIAEIFYSMVAKGYSLKHVLVELNKRLKAIFPPGIFCRACLVDIDFTNKRAYIWNAGVPDCYIWRKRGGVSAIISAHQFPLGVVEENHFDAQIQEVDLDYGDKIYLFSDELLKIKNTINNKELGQEGLTEIFRNSQKGEGLFQELLQELEKYKNDPNNKDKITLAEITCSPPTEGGKRVAENIASQAHMQDWTFSMELRPASLREFDPLPLLMNILMECPDLHDYRGALYTILGELYSNALEHGILKMDSKLKMHPNGFSEYYEVRMNKLQNLQIGFIRFIITHVPETKGNGFVEIVIEDSGEGFNYVELNTQLKKSSLYSGRGIPLIKHLAEEIQFEGKGNKVRVKLRFSKADGM